MSVEIYARAEDRRSILAFGLCAASGTGPGESAIALKGVFREEPASDSRAWARQDAVTKIPQTAPQRISIGQIDGRDFNGRRLARKSVASDLFPTRAARKVHRKNA